LHDADREYIEIGIRTASTIHNVLARHGHSLADFPAYWTLPVGAAELSISSSATFQKQKSMAAITTHDLLNGAPPTCRVNIA